MRKRVLLIFVVIVWAMASCSQSKPVPGTVTSTPDISQNLVNPSPSPVPTKTPILSKTVLDVPIYGLHIHKLASEEQLTLGKQAGVYWTRFIDFHWDSIEPVQMDPPVYQWPIDIEEGLKLATDSGFEVIGDVLYSPDWAQKYPGIACGPIADEAFDEFADFMGALVSRYSQPPYNIHYWEIGNEPDIDRALVPPDMFFGCWGEEGDLYYGGGYYAEMLKVVYPAIKAADPEAQVLVGGLNLDCDPKNPPEHPSNSGQLKDCAPSRFLEGILLSGGGDYFDGVSFHAYDYYFGNNLYANGNWHSDSVTTGPVLITKSRYLNELLAEYGVDGKYLINSELALLCGSTGKEPHCKTDDFSNTKANYLAQAYAAAMAEGLSGNIWYSLTGWRASGLVAGSNQPSAAYDAYRFSESQLGNTDYVGEVNDFPNVMGYEFTREGKPVWILWTMDGEIHDVQLISIPSAVYNVFGHPLNATQSIAINPAPIYIEWSD